MRFKLLGSSGLKVSELCLGGMTLGDAWGWGADAGTSKEILSRYSEAGGRFIDTSCNYTNGQSESIIGEYIKGDRDRYVIATKYSLHDHRYPNDPNAAGNARKNLIRSLKGSLERLQTDYVDVLYLHMWDYSTSVREIMRTLDDLVASTKVNYIGISDTPAWIASRANTMAEHFGWEPFVVFQFSYNLSFRDAEREIIPMCKKFDLTMAPFNVLGAGLFTGKYTRKDSPEGRLQPGKWGNASERGLTIAQEVDAIADELEVPSSHVAIAWIRGQPGVFTPIIGARTPEQMAETIASLEVKLTDDHYARLDQKVREMVGFNWGYPKGWLVGAREVLYGKSYDRVDNHRLYE